MAGSFVAGCVPFEKTSPFWGTIGAGFRGQPGTPQVGREYADQLPYASMLAWFKGSPKALVVLAEFGPGEMLTWRSAERQSITTFGPFVASLIGLDLELRSTSFDGTWSANPLALVGRRMTRTLDVAVEGERRNVALQSSFRLGEMQSVTIEGKTYRLREVRETVSAAGKARFENRYWVDPGTGRCWKSRQIAIPTFPAFNTEILKYPVQT